MAKCVLLRDSPQLRQICFSPLCHQRLYRPSSATFASRQCNLLPPRRLRFTNPWTLGELGCISSMLPLQSVVSNARLTSYIVVDVHAFCDLSQDTSITLVKIAGMIVTFAMIIWKALMCNTGSESPVVVVLFGRLELGVKRDDIVVRLRSTISFDKVITQRNPRFHPVSQLVKSYIIIFLLRH